jgi:membrane protein YqaA with SNARE-associated domain
MGKVFDFIATLLVAMVFPGGPPAIAVGFYVGVTTQSDSTGWWALLGTALVVGLVGGWWMGFFEPPPAKRSMGPTPSHLIEGSADRRAYYKNHGLD